LILGSNEARQCVDHLCVDLDSTGLEGPVLSAHEHPAVDTGLIGCDRPDGPTRAVLQAADTRLNKDATDAANQKEGSSRALPRFAAPLKKSMLCNCVSKQRPGATKKAPLGDGAGAAQIAKKISSC
jgi:hypothetical protein